MPLCLTKKPARPHTRQPPADPADSRSAYAEAVIDLGAIAHNTSVLAGRAASAELMAVVKADGFGHGALPVARTALAHGATWLGVTSTDEAIRLRKAGVQEPILSWMHLPTENFAPAILACIDLAVPSLSHLAGVASGAERAGVPATVHLKVDTGLHRGGAALSEWPQLVKAARTFERRGLVRVRGLWSHLVHGDQPEHPTTEVQIRRFEAAVDFARTSGLRPDLLHLANSAAGLAAPATHYDLVRAGLGIYGIEPCRGRNFGLRPAMTLRGRAIMARRVAGGEGISYGHSYLTHRPTGLLLVPLGFADGISRVTSGKAQMWIAGERCPVVGKIAMDQCVVDVGDASVGIGEEVVVFGTGDHGEPTAAEWAEWGGTIPHEVLTGVGARIPRHYLPAPAADRNTTKPAGTHISAEEYVTHD